MESAAHRHRAVPSAGTADGNDQRGFALRQIQGQQKPEHLPEFFHKGFRIGVRKHVIVDGVILTGLFPQFGYVVGIFQKPHVQHQIGLVRDAVFEAEGAHRDHQRCLALFPEQVDEMTLQVGGGKGGGIDDVIGLTAHGLHQLPLLLDGSCQTQPVHIQRMTAAAGLLPVDEHLVGALQKEDAAAAAVLFHVLQRPEQEGMIPSAPNVHHKGHFFILFGAAAEQFHKLGDQLDRHIVDAVVADVLQNVHRKAFTRAAQAGNDEAIHDRRSFQRMFLANIRRMLQYSRR